MKYTEDIIQVDDIGYGKGGRRQGKIKANSMDFASELEAASRDAGKLRYQGAHGPPSLILTQHWVISVTSSDYNND